VEHKGFTIWFTGLSGAGKSTIAQRVRQALMERNIKVELLDGDVVRTNLSKGLGFSKEDRDTNIRRIAFVCHLLTRNNVGAIAAAISPYRAIRDEVRELIGNFVEVFVDAPLEVCEERDIKGLYAKARRGEIKQFTGIDDPYEAPHSPEVVCFTARETPDESAARVLQKLEELGYLDGIAQGALAGSSTDRLPQVPDLDV
jgi:adenylylsulfate kinase